MIIKIMTTATIAKTTKTIIMRISTTMTSAQQYACERSSTHILTYTHESIHTLVLYTLASAECLYKITSLEFATYTYASVAIRRDASAENWIGYDKNIYGQGEEKGKIV